eukprot:Sspe_Gene.594::Locus_195_Transcript_1_1_Confidence_1.000_Length_2423::g.594::m.594
MGNTHQGHAMAKLEAACQEVTINKDPDERLGLNMNKLVVASIDEPSAAHRHGCNVYIGMRLLSVNGKFVATAADVRTAARGSTSLILRFAPKELPLHIEKRTPSDPIGLVMSPDGVLIAVGEGTPAKKAGADTYIGLKVVSVNGAVVATSEEINEACIEDKSITLGFSIPFPDPQATSNGHNDPKPILDELQQRLEEAKAQVAKLEQQKQQQEELRLSQERCKELAMKEAHELWIYSPNKWQHCGGQYHVEPDAFANGWPVWKKITIEADRWLYSTPNGYWRVTDSREDFETGAGYIISSDKHNGRMPNQMPMWQTKGYQDDPDIRVTIAEEGDLNGINIATPAPGTKVRVIKHTKDDAFGVGCGGVVVGPTDEGLLEVKSDDGASHFVSPLALHPEGEDEGVIFKIATAGIGMKFDGGPTDLTLKDVIGSSPADKFKIKRFVGRRLTHVNNTAVETTSDIQMCVAGRTLIVLKFSPLSEITAEESKLLRHIIRAEETGRESVVEEEAACHLLLCAKLLAIYASHLKNCYGAWIECKANLKKAVVEKISEGGPGGAYEAMKPFEEQQEILVKQCGGIVTAGKYPLENGAALRNPANTEWAQVEEALREYETVLPQAEALAEEFRDLQEKLDELDDTHHKIKRQLNRRPGDASLKAQFEAVQREELSTREAQQGKVEGMRKFAEVVPQLYIYVLQYEQEREEGPQLSETPTNSSPVPDDERRSSTSHPLDILFASSVKNDASLSSKDGTLNAPQLSPQPTNGTHPNGPSLDQPALQTGTGNVVL